MQSARPGAAHRDQARRPRRGKVLRRCPGWPIDRFSTIEPAWRGATVICLGGGPSLNDDQFARVARAKAAQPEAIRVIAINNAYLKAPEADVVYFADKQWWDWHKANPAFTGHSGQRCTIFHTGGLVEDPAIHILRNGGSEGLSTEPDTLNTGLNSGYQAINFALLAGASRIVLLGYDMKFDGPRDHWHAGHPVKVGETMYRVAYAKYFNLLASRVPVPVLNASADTALTCFPRVALESVLPDPSPAALPA